MNSPLLPTSMRYYFFTSAMVRMTSPLPPVDGGVESDAVDFTLGLLLSARPDVFEDFLAYVCQSVSTADIKSNFPKAPARICANHFTKIINTALLGDETGGWVREVPEPVVQMLIEMRQQFDGARAQWAEASGRNAEDYLHIGLKALEPSVMQLLVVQSSRAKYIRDNQAAAPEKSAAVMPEADGAPVQDALKPRHAHTEDRKLPANLQHLLDEAGFPGPHTSSVAGSILLGTIHVTKRPLRYPVGDETMQQTLTRTGKQVREQTVFQRDENWQVMPIIMEGEVRDATLVAKEG